MYLKQNGYALGSTLFIIFLFTILTLWFVNVTYQKRLWGEFKAKYVEKSLIEIDFVKSMESVPLTAQIVPGEYRSNFDFEGEEIEFDYYFSTFDNTLSKAIYVNGELQRKAQARYRVVGSSVHYYNIEGDKGVFPALDAISVTDNKITFIRKDSPNESTDVVLTRLP